MLRGSAAFAALFLADHLTVRLGRRVERAADCFIAAAYNFFFGEMVFFHEPAFYEEDHATARSQ